MEALLGMIIENQVCTFVRTFFLNVEHRLGIGQQVPFESLFPK
jgi:hypothetical protein